MKFIHISDLHFGKSFHGYSLIDTGDQKYWIAKFMEVIEEEKPDAIVIAGDVYDRSVAPKDAIKLFSEFVVNISKKEIPLLIIAGNHDSGVRLASMSELLKKHNVHIVGEVTKEMEKVTLKDEYGDVHFYLVPYLFPAAVEQALGISGIKEYTEAMELLLAEQDIDFTQRNVIVSHQTVTNSGNEPEKGGSEEMIGGVGGIDLSAYQGFDYVALGHIHAAQKLKYDYIRYSGSPLCYHFDEINHPNKGPIVVEMKSKNEPLSITTRKIEPLHQLRQVEGTLQEICEAEKSINNTNEYIKVVLTDNYLPVGAINTLEALFKVKNSIVMETSHRPGRIYKHEIVNNHQSEELSLEELFKEFYKEKNNGEYPDEQDSKLIEMICEQIVNSDDDAKPDKPSDQDIDSIIDFVLKMEVE